jgi:hypothetical protein
MNDERTPVRYYNLRDKRGELHPISVRSAADAAKTAAIYWPDEQQDPDRTGVGWDVEAFDHP